MRKVERSLLVGKLRLLPPDIPEINSSFAFRIGKFLIWNVPFPIKTRNYPARLIRILKPVAKLPDVTSYLIYDVIKLEDPPEAILLRKYLTSATSRP